MIRPLNYLLAEGECRIFEHSVSEGICLLQGKAPTQKHKSTVRNSHICVKEGHRGSLGDPTHNAGPG